MGSAVLGQAISAIRDWSVNEGKELAPGTRLSETFGCLVFNDEVQQARLPKPVYRALRKTITQGVELDLSMADAVASAMKEWAVEHGATHYTHWFQPLTGITAEKHDSFLVQTGDGQAVARNSSRASPTRRASRRAARAARSRRAATRRGTRRARPGSSSPAPRPRWSFRRRS